MDGPEAEFFVEPIRYLLILGDGSMLLPKTKRRYGHAQRSDYLSLISYAVEQGTRYSLPIHENCSCISAPQHRYLKAGILIRASFPMVVALKSTS